MNTISRISKLSVNFVLVLAMVTISGLMVSAAGTVSFLTIDYPAASQTKLYGINPAGDIVGDYRSSDNAVHGFLLRNGVFTSIDYPGAAWTQAWGINQQGDIVGQYGVTGSTAIHGFQLRNGVYSNIDLSGQENSMPYKIAENGTVAGCTHGAGYMWGFVTSSAGTTLDPEMMSMHTGINANGDVTGNYTDPSTGLFIYSYVINRGWKTWFTVPGSYVTRSWDISPNGEVVGFYRDPTPASRPFHGFLYTNYRRRTTITSIDVNLPGVTGTQAYGINAAGDIVGFYNVGSVAHGFLRTSQATQYRPGPKDDPGPDRGEL